MSKILSSISTYTLVVNTKSSRDASITMRSMVPHLSSPFHSIRLFSHSRSNIVQRQKFVERALEFDLPTEKSGFHSSVLNLVPLGLSNLRNVEAAFYPSSSHRIQIETKAGSRQIPAVSSWRTHHMYFSMNLPLGRGRCTCVLQTNFLNTHVVCQYMIGWTIASMFRHTAWSTFLGRHALLILPFW